MALLMSWYQHILEQHTLNISIHLPPAFDLILVHWCIGSNDRFSLTGWCCWSSFHQLKIKAFPKIVLALIQHFIYLTELKTDSYSIVCREWTDPKWSPYSGYNYNNYFFIISWIFIYKNPWFTLYENLWLFIVSKNLSIHIRVIYAYT